MMHKVCDRIFIYTYIYIYILCVWYAAVCFACGCMLQLVTRCSGQRRRQVRATNGAGHGCPDVQAVTSATPHAMRAFEITVVRPICTPLSLLDLNFAPQVKAA